MSDGWLSPQKYEHTPILGCTGPGTMVAGYAWKVVLHTTESRPGSIDAVTNLFAAKPCYCPQFALDVSTGRRVQYIPWSWSAAALKGCDHGGQTNRGCAVQVELVGFAQDTPDWPDEWLWVVADWIADLIVDGVPINLDNVFDFQAMTGVLAVSTSRYRASEAEYQRVDGIRGHVTTHCQDHWDPGKIDGFKIARMAKEILGGNYTGPTGSTSAGASSNVDGERSEYIRSGMEGGLVEFAQQLLIKLGYDCGPDGADGVFGAGTEAGVRAFQSASGLDADGIIGPQTQAAISAACGNTAGTPVPGAPVFPGRYLLQTDPMLEGGDVREWQAKMAERGWPIDVDGAYGSECEQQCSRFQGEKGLTVDGVVGPMTWAATWSAPVT